MKELFSKLNRDWKISPLSGWFFVCKKKFCEIFNKYGKIPPKKVGFLSLYIGGDKIIQIFLQKRQKEVYFLPPQIPIYMEELICSFVKVL